MFGFVSNREVVVVSNSWVVYQVVIWGVGSVQSWLGFYLFWGQSKVFVFQVVFILEEECLVGDWLELDMFLICSCWFCFQGIGDSCRFSSIFGLDSEESRFCV